MTTEAHPAVPSDTDVRRPIPRAAVVWGAFAAASAVAVGILWALAPARGSDALHAMREGREQPLGASVAAAKSSAPRISPRDTPMARGRWDAIVIHESGTPAGDVASIERRHLDSGLAGLGYHFVIGNGQGLDDGQVVAGYRWERQLPGAHVAVGMRAPRAVRAHAGTMDAAALNRSAIGICLVGNGDRRPFTDLQMRELVGLVRALQAELGITSDAVFFHRELQPGSPGAGHFELSGFRAQILP